MLREFRLAELQSDDKVLHIRVGLATMVPIDYLLLTFTSTELETVFCGMPTISLETLKRTTIYQAGLSETNRHIQHFWTVLHTFTQSQLQAFVKFACNQERLPVVRDGHGDPHSSESLPPPYPMKVAPADRMSHDDTTDDNPDRRLIRAETCIFLVKLPAYSSLEVMRQKLLFSISNSLDPLSG